jgi:hypothetical protein
MKDVQRYRVTALQQVEALRIFIKSWVSCSIGRSSSRDLNFKCWLDIPEDARGRLVTSHISWRGQRMTSINDNVAEPLEMG